MMSTPRFRCYRTNDVTGVELGGALKNVLAIGERVYEWGGSAAVAHRWRDVVQPPTHVGLRLPAARKLSSSSDPLRLAPIPQPQPVVSQTAWALAPMAVPRSSRAAWTKLRAWQVGDDGRLGGL